LFFFSNTLLTNISSSDIFIISEDDISVTEVFSMANTALTEAVYYILLSLLSPRHGYGIMQNAEVLSGGRVKLAAGTLYGAINSLLEKGWIMALPGEKDSRKKEYVITEEGRAVLKTELARLQELVANGTRIMEEQV
jgi:DNA-binding PadR family transcriptional regulator